MVPVSNRVVRARLSAGEKSGSSSDPHDAVGRMPSFLRWLHGWLRGVRLRGVRHIRLGPGVTLESGTLIDGRYGRVCIGRGAWIGPRVSMLTGSDGAPSTSVQGAVSVGTETRIGEGAILLSGASVGARVVVAPFSVIAGHVTAGDIVAGQPARTVGRVAADGAWVFGSVRSGSEG